MKKTIYLFLAVLAAAALTGCGSTKKIAYLQGAETLTAEQLAQQTVPLYDARIMPKDLLTITVTATDPESVQPFNLIVPAVKTGLVMTSQPQLQPYLVDNNGQIDFPVLGMITLKGLTKRQAEEKITGLLSAYLKEEPVVTVSFVNYKIAVLGEVARPNTFTISNEKVNIFEALAMAGDMTSIFNYFQVIFICNSYYLIHFCRESSHMNYNDSFCVFCDIFFNFDWIDI